MANFTEAIITIIVEIKSIFSKVFFHNQLSKRILQFAMIQFQFRMKIFFSDHFSCVTQE